MSTGTKQRRRGKGGRFGTGNSVARRHGLYSPKLGPGLTYPDKQSREYRRQLEAACLKAHGEVDVTAATLIHSAVECQRLALANRYQRLEAERSDGWSADLGLRFDAEYRRSLEARDKRVAALKLRADPQQSIADLLYGPRDAADWPDDPDDPDAVQDSRDATGAQPEPQAGDDETQDSEGELSG